MKAPIAQAAVEAASAPGYALFFNFWGLEIVKFI
jgi:peroxiredoxin family protein